MAYYDLKKVRRVLKVVIFLLDLLKSNEKKASS